MVNKQKKQPQWIWIKRQIKDSDYPDHWEYKKIEKKHLAAYSKSRWSRGIWQIHSKLENVAQSGFDTRYTMRIDDSKIVVAKANVKIV